MECHSIIDSKDVIMKESSDSDLPPLSVNSKGVKNPLRTAVTSPHFIERQCPYCESASIVEKTSLCGSVPTNYSPSIWTDSVLLRASPAHTKSPTNSSASNRTPVMTHRVQREFVVEVHSSQQKEERGIPTPVFASTTSPAVEVHQRSDETYQQNGDKLNQHNDHQKHDVHQQNNEIHQQKFEIHQQHDEIYNKNDEILKQNDDTLSLNVTECDKTVRKQKGDAEISTPVVCEDHEEVVLNEPPVNDISFKYDESPEISFETTIGSLPSKDAFPKNKPSHSRSRSMDLQAQRLNPKRTTYSRHLSGKARREEDEPELSYAASLMEYATQKKLLKSSEASLDSSLSGAATPSDSLAPVRNSTLSSSDSRSVTPTDKPYSMDDPLYIHNSFKLYLDMKVFDDDEEFKLLLRVSHLIPPHKYT